MIRGQRAVGLPQLVAGDAAARLDGLLAGLGGLGDVDRHLVAPGLEPAAMADGILANGTTAQALEEGHQVPPILERDLERGHERQRNVEARLLDLLEEEVDLADVSYRGQVRPDVAVGEAGHGVTPDAGVPGEEGLPTLQVFGGVELRDGVAAGAGGLDEGGLEERLGPEGVLAVGQWGREGPPVALVADGAAQLAEGVWGDRGVGPQRLLPVLEAGVVHRHMAGAAAVDALLAEAEQPVLADLDRLGRGGGPAGRAGPVGLLLGPPGLAHGAEHGRAQDQQQQARGGQDHVTDGHLGLPTRGRRAPSSRRGTGCR
jgi:hypothetical protein